MEVTQFTYFQQMAGFECKPVSAEITYGLERLAMFIQGKKSVFDIEWNKDGVTYDQVFKQSEKEFSAYNFEHANTDNLLTIFNFAETECKNLLDARGVISVSERAGYITRIRNLAKGCGEVWLKSQG